VFSMSAAEARIHFHSGSSTLTCDTLSNANACLPSLVSSAGAKTITVNDTVNVSGARLQIRNSDGTLDLTTVTNVNGLWLELVETGVIPPTAVNANTKLSKLSSEGQTT